MHSSEKPSTGIFDEEQRKRINHFFALVRIGWGVAKFNSQFGDEEDLRHTKRFYAQQILQYTPQRLAEAVEMGVNLRGQGDEDFLFPDVAKILGLIGSDWESKRLHKPYDPNVALVDLGEGKYLPAPDKMELWQLRAFMRAHNMEPRKSTPKMLGKINDMANPSDEDILQIVSELLG